MDTQTQAQCPPWCGWEPGRCDGYHMSAPDYMPTTTGPEALDVSLSRDNSDEGDPNNPTEVGVTVFSHSIEAGTVDLTPAQVVGLMERLRERVFTAAGPDGLDMPVERVRLGDQIRVGDGWETVETLTVDGWCCGQPPVAGHGWAVYVGTDAIDDDNDSHQYAHGDVVRVRAVQS